MVGYIRGLDGLRSVAILWVMFAHVSAASKWVAEDSYHKVFELIASAGWVGVQLFFVISGYLITKILLKGKGAPKQLRYFYLRRSLRIFPVYYVTLFFLFILLPFMGYSLSWLASETDNQVYFWTYLNNWIRPYIHNKGFAHLWSLAIEEQFYLIWPFVVIYFSKSSLFRISVFMIISAPIFRFLLFYYFQTDQEGIGAKAAYAFTFARWDAIALGALMAVAVTSEKHLFWLQKNIIKVFSVSMTLVLLHIGFNRTFNAVGDGGLELLNQSSSAIVCFAIVFLVAWKNQSWYVGLLEFSFLRLIGKYSYSMYIFHLPIMIAWFQFNVPDYTNMSGISVMLQVFLNCLIIFVLTFTLSAVSWSLLEHPLLRLKGRYQNNVQ